jgi:hypothetical protein
MFPSAGKRLGESLVHHFDSARVRVENVPAILKIISNQQVHVAIAVEIGPRRAGGKPTFALSLSSTGV